MWQRGHLGTTPSPSCVAPRLVVTPGSPLLFANEQVAVVATCADKKFKSAQQECQPGALQLDNLYLLQLEPCDSEHRLA